MSRSVQMIWALLEVFVLAVFVWTLYGLTTWSNVSAEIINNSPDAYYTIRRLISITLLSLGILGGLGLGAVVLGVAALKGSHRDSGAPLNIALLIFLVLIPVGAFIAVVGVGGVI